MDRPQLTTFLLARYRFEWQAGTPIRVPDYAGSMLRGAFGHALRQLACMTRQRVCPGCSLLSTWPYAAIFTPPLPSLQNSCLSRQYRIGSIA